VGEEGTERKRLSREALAAAALLVLGVGPRILFAARFPVAPFSDFRALIDFGLALRDRGAAESWHWVQFNPGLPVALSLLFRVAPGSEAVARLATAVATGLLPLLPFFLWRSVLELRWRTLAGLLLALWPGQVFFSGVVAQENWVLLPAVALGALAVRVLRARAAAPRPVAAGILLAAAAAIRQEMLVVLAPAALAAVGLTRQDGSRLRRAGWLAVAAGLPLAALAYQRFAATGRFAITTEHGGLALLGSVVPGAAAPGWIDPKAYIASVEPELLMDRAAARKAATRLALAEWKRRPFFHTLRALAAAGRLSVESDADNLFWSVGSPDALPAAHVARGREFYARWFPRLKWELALIQGLFLASVLEGLRRKDAAILVLAGCVAAKFALQSVASPLGRLMVPATALELLVIALGAACVVEARRFAASARFAILALASAAALLLLEPRVNALAAARDEPPPRVSRFPLEISGGGGFAQCVVEEGEVTFLEWKRAWMRPAETGRKARVLCGMPPAAAGESLVLRLEESPGAPTGGLTAGVEVDGRPMPSGGARELVLGQDALAPARTVALGFSGPGGFSFVRALPR
jgi:hypothetical protein